MVKLAQALFITSAAGFLAGAGMLVWSLDPTGWGDLSDGFVWYLQGRSPLELLAPLMGLCLLAAVALLLTARKARARAAAASLHGSHGGVGDALPQGMELDQEQLVQRARHALEQVLRRSKPKLAQVMDVLLGVPVDLGVSGLSLQPSGSDSIAAVKVVLALGDIQLQVTTMRPALYEEVLHELRQMARVGEAGEGVIKFQSSRRLDRLRVALTHQKTGIGTTIEVLGESVSAVQRKGERRRTNSVVFRLEPALRNIRTGELQALPMEENDATDPSSGTVTGIDPSGEHEVEPLVVLRNVAPRRVGGLEVGLRLVLATLTTLLVLFFFWNAYAWAVAHLFSGGAPSWRAVSLRIESSPVPGAVSIQGQAKGRTPLETRVSCRGRAIKILVQAQGYSTWQWNGVCPDQEQLSLRARLKPLR